MKRESDYKERQRPGDWFSRAACLGMDPDIFFPTKGGSSRQAKKVCWEQCPVREECLEHAQVNQELDGIYGGLTASERRPDRIRRPQLSTTACGTERGWRKHRMAGEEPCAKCRCAHAATLPPNGPFPA